MWGGLSGAGIQKFRLSGFMDGVRAKSGVAYLICRNDMRHHSRVSQCFGLVLSGPIVKVFNLLVAVLLASVECQLVSTPKP